ncbi:magnesium/cobalt transporter CorA [bacterium]|nr:magnesium/cobalt transporter CorA [bacterium]
MARPRLHFPRPALRRRMHQFRRRTAPGAPPGVLAADPESHATAITLVAFGPQDFVESSLDNIGEMPARGTFPVVWVNVIGLRDVEKIREVAIAFDLHRLAMEDVLNVHQRVKVEAYDDVLYVVTHAAETIAGGHLQKEQVSLFFGEGFVVSFQERPGDCFATVRDRLRNDAGRVRRMGADYLAYVLLDTVIDHYFPILEEFGERLDRVEDRVLFDVEPSTGRDVHEIKRELLALRRAAWPLRELLNTILREHDRFVTAETRLYYRDCYDHAIQIIDLLEIYRELAASLMDSYMSGMSVRLNEVMKVLTIIATIFIPLSFITGLYGMNFDTSSPLNMPELSWRFGYPFALGIMAATAGGLVFYFYRKGWFGDASNRNKHNRNEKTAKHEHR